MKTTAPPLSIMKQLYKKLRSRSYNLNCKLKFYKRQKIAKRIKSIAIIYYIPKANKEKYHNWEDGFTKAVNLLHTASNLDISWINLVDSQPNAQDLNKFDFLLVKSCWNAYIDRYVRGLPGLTTKRGIAISCSAAPLDMNMAWFYDVLWYETRWYEPLISYHPNKVLAFGINSDIFTPMNLEKKYDILGIGALAKYKRFHKFNDMDGENKLIIGTTATNDFKEVKEALDPRIKIIDYLPQKQLAQYINESKLVYIPSTLNGGGERAILEALSCRVPIKIEADNPKLESMLNDKNQPISKTDYYHSLIKGLSLIDKKIIS